MDGLSRRGFFLNSVFIISKILWALSHFLAADVIRSFYEGEQESKMFEMMPPFCFFVVVVSLFVNIVICHVICHS